MPPKKGSLWTMLHDTRPLLSGHPDWSQGWFGLEGAHCTIIQNQFQYNTMQFGRIIEGGSPYHYYSTLTTACNSRWRWCWSNAATSRMKFVLRRSRSLGWIVSFRSTSDRVTWRRREGCLFNHSWTGRRSQSRRLRLASSSLCSSPLFNWWKR